MGGRLTEVTKNHPESTVEIYASLFGIAGLLSD